MLRYVGIEPPKCHDVSPLLVLHQGRFKNISSKEVANLAKISRELKKEREFAFNGDIDFIPTEEYTPKDAKKAMEDTKFVFTIAKRLRK